MATTLAEKIIARASGRASVTHGEVDAAHLDIEAATLHLTKKEETIRLKPLPDNLKRMLADGGLVPHLKKRFAAERTKETGQ